MDPNRFILILLNIVLFSLGVGLGAILELNLTPLDFGFGPVIGFAIISFGFFVLSAGFFGMLTPVLFLYLGLVESGVIVQNPIGVVFLLIATSISSATGNILGEAAGKDLNGVKSLSEYSTTIALGVVLSLLVAATAGFIYGLEIKIPFL